MLELCLFPRTEGVNVDWMCGCDILLWFLFPDAGQSFDCNLSFIPLIVVGDSVVRGGPFYCAVIPHANIRVCINSTARFSIDLNLLQPVLREIQWDDERFRKPIPSPFPQMSCPS